MQGSLIRALLMGALAIAPAVSNAASVRIQNANLDQGINTVFVKGVTDAVLPGTPVHLINAETGALMASDLDGNKQVSFRVALPQGQKAPCTVVVRAGAVGDLESVTAIAQVRHATGCTVQTLRISGVVTDSPIAFATIAVTLNGVTYTTIANELGEYEFDIATATVSELVTIEATRRNETGETVPIDFVSLAGSFSKLLADADGGVLSSDKTQKTNITNVSTAEYVLLIEANGGTAPTTVEELQQAETKVDATELIELAAVIKLIVDGGQSLPGNFNTILEFIQEPAAVETFVAALPEGALEATVAEILADNDLVAGFQVDQVPARYFVSFPAEPGFLARGGDVYEFSAVRPNDCASIGSGCTGYYMTRDVNGSPIGVPIEWYIELGTLEMAVMAPTALSRVATAAQFSSVLPQAVMTDGTPFSTCATSSNLNFIESIVGYSFTRFSDGQTVDGLSRRSDLRYSNFQPVLCADGQTRIPANVVLRSTGNVLARDSGSIAPRRFVRASVSPVAADEIVADGQWALQVLGDLLIAGNSTPRRAIFADNVRLNEDGTSSSDIAAEQNSGPSSWTIDAVTGELVITYPDGWVQRVIVTDELDGNGDGTIDQYGAFSVFTGPGGARFASSDPAFRRDTSLVINAGLVGNPLGKYWQTVVNAWTPDAWEDVPGSTTGERRLSLANNGFFGFRAVDVGGGFRGTSAPPVTTSPCGLNTRWSRNGFIGFEVSETETLNIVAMRNSFDPDPFFDQTRIWSVLSVDSVPNPSVNGATQRRLSVIEMVRFEARTGSPHNFPPRVNFYREFTEPSIDRGLCASGFVPQF